MGSTTDKIKGRVKEAVGVLTDNDRLKREGQTDQVVGEVKEPGRGEGEGQSGAGRGEGQGRLRGTRPAVLSPMGFCECVGIWK